MARPKIDENLKSLSWFRCFQLHDELYLPPHLIREIEDERSELPVMDLDRPTPYFEPPRPAPVSVPTAARKRLPGQPKLKIFDPQALSSLVRQVEGLSRSNERRALMESLNANLGKLIGGFAPLARVPRNLTARLSRLREEMPNFACTLDFIAPLLRLQQAGDRTVRLPPLLLEGPPGIGKSYFAERLADVLELHYRAVGLEATTAHWVISGANLTWQSGGPGIVLETLAAAQHANPLVLLDEVDKADPDYRHSPLKALYTLLEPNSARIFRDESAPNLILDASAINWVLTSNDSSRVPEPLLSRMQRVEIPAPDLGQRRKIVAVVYHKMRKSNRWGRKFAPILKPRTIDTLATLDDSVRQLQRVLMQACANAFEARRSEIEPHDIAAAIRGPRQDLDSMPAEGNA